MAEGKQVSRVLLMMLMVWACRGRPEPFASMPSPTPSPAPARFPSPTSIFTPSTPEVELQRHRPLPPTWTPTPTPAPLPVEQACEEPEGLVGKLAYIHEGDLWIRELPAGSSIRLTHGGLMRMPRWSPSGRWLAAVHGEAEVQIFDTGGKLVQSLSGVSFRWSPVADLLAVRTAEGALLRVAPGEAPQILLEPGAGIQELAWSPDGRWIAYSGLRILEGEKDVYTGQPGARYAFLGRVRAAGGRPEELLNAGRPSEFGLILAGWSPDGHALLYWVDPMFSASLLADGVPLWALPVRGGPARALTMEPMLLYEDFLAPSPKGDDRIAVVVGGYRGAWTSKQLHLLSVRTRESQVLFSGPYAVSSPAWSADGTRIAFIAMPDRGDLAGGEEARRGLLQRRLFVVDVDGGSSGPRWEQLTDDPAYRDEYPRWLGEWIIFIRLDRWDRISLWAIPASGGSPCWILERIDAPLTWFGYYGHLDWGNYLDVWRPPAP